MYFFKNGFNFLGIVVEKISICNFLGILFVKWFIFFKNFILSIKLVLFIINVFVVYIINVFLFIKLNK